MKVLVVFGSHLGSTTSVAERIGTVLEANGCEATVLPAAVADSVGGYDAFVIGGGTYAGRWHADAVAFIRRHAELLLNRPVWLFSSGPLGAAGREEPKEPVEIAELAPLVKARAHAVFAGAHDRATVEASDLGRIEKFIAKRFIPEGDWRDWPSIEAWACSIALELHPKAIAAL